MEIKPIPIISYYNPDIRVEIEVEKDILFKMAKEWKYHVFVKECTYQKIYYMITPHYVFIAKEKKRGDKKWVSIK